MKAKFVGLWVVLVLAVNVACGGDPEPTATPVHETDSGGCTGDQVDVNSAPAEELDRIKHIGPERAGQMLTLRPFTSLDDLVRIKGISTNRLAGIKEEGLACIGG